MSVGIWRQDDREDRTPSRSFKQKFALMLTHYPVGHEQTQSGARLFGGEVRFEKMVAIVVGDAWPERAEHREIGLALLGELVALRGIVKDMRRALERLRAMK